MVIDSSIIRNRAAWRWNNGDVWLIGLSVRRKHDILVWNMRIGVCGSIVDRGTGLNCKRCSMMYKLSSILNLCCAMNDLNFLFPGVLSLCMISWIFWRWLSYDMSSCLGADRRFWTLNTGLPRPVYMISTSHLHSSSWWFNFRRTKRWSSREWSCWFDINCQWFCKKKSQKWQADWKTRMYM